jgi:hypothetical protein
MKVERARSEESVNDRSETKARNVQIQTAPGTSPGKAAEAPNQGAFSKILEAARPASENDRTEKKTAEAENDSSVDKTADGKNDEAVEAKDSRRDDQNAFSGESGGEDSPGWVPAPILASDLSSETNITAPPARAILHVADLERIVSAVRSDSFAGSKQVTIDLKNSVLDGLRIQLTLTEQGNLKAEFIALNEQIKKQLDARKNELQSVLKDRSIKCGELKIRVLAPDEESVPRAKGYEEERGLSIA